MTAREHRAYRELHQRLLLLSCQTCLLLCDCRDTHGQVIAEEAVVRRQVLHGLREICQCVHPGDDPAGTP